MDRRVRVKSSSSAGLQAPPRPQGASPLGDGMPSNRGIKAVILTKNVSEVYFNSFADKWQNKS